MKVLITGWSGTGKSTIYKELACRGLNALDADDRTLQLCSWVDIATGKDLGRNFPADFSTKKYDWHWNESVLKDILRVNDSVYLCGNANNALTFYPLFDQVFVLNIDEAEQRRRMSVRVEHDFGKDAATQDAVIAQQIKLVSEASLIGAHLIDASPPAPQIADTILERLSHDN